MGTPTGLDAPSFHIELPCGGDGAFRASLRSLLDTLMAPGGHHPRFAVTATTGAITSELDDDTLFWTARGAGHGRALNSFAVTWDSPDLQVRIVAVDGEEVTYRGRMLSPGQTALAETLDFARSRDEGSDETTTTAHEASKVADAIASIVACVDVLTLDQPADEVILELAAGLDAAGVADLPADALDATRRAAHRSSDINVLLDAAQAVHV